MEAIKNKTENKNWYSYSMNDRIILSQSGMEIARISDNGESKEELEFRSKLVKSAPELLEALNTLIEHLELKDAREENQYIKETFFKRMPEFLGYIKAGKNAIKKATE